MTINWNAIVTYKDNANRVKYKVKTQFSTFNPEVLPILSKDMKLIMKQL